MEDYDFDWGTPDNSDPTVDLNVKWFTLDSYYGPVFDQVCEGLKTSTLIKTFGCAFEKIKDEQCLTQLLEAINASQSIERIIVYIDEPIDKQRLRKLFDGISRNIKSVTLDVKQVSDNQTLSSLIECKLHSPTKNFKLFLDGCQGELLNKQFYANHIELLQRSNINKLCWSEVDLFGDPVTLNHQGWQEFCEYLTKTDKLRTLRAYTANLTCADAAALANYVRNSKNLTNLQFGFTDKSLSLEEMETVVDLCKAIAQSNIRSARIDCRLSDSDMALGIATSDIIRLSTKLEIFGFECDMTNCEEVVKAINEALQDSESVRVCEVINGNFKQRGISNDLTLRNRKLQNSQVRAFITILFNIARATSSSPQMKLPRATSSVSSSTTLPRDIWPIIMSFVRVPGVSLDFGLIAQSIFKDSTVRRVIYKPVK